MKILAIDYGERKVGLAIGDSSSKLAEPLKVIRYRKEIELLEKISKIVEAQQVELIIAGISEGKQAEKTKEFVKRLKEKLSTPVVFQDETLTTKEAQRYSIEAGINRKKRKKLEDAFSAALILQEYLNKK
jgi:putative Holliday junction resolvase